MISTKYSAGSVICYFEESDEESPVYGIVAAERLVIGHDKQADKIRKRPEEKRVWFFSVLGGPAFMLEKNVFECKVKPQTKGRSLKKAVDPVVDELLKKRK